MEWRAVDEFTDVTQVLLDGMTCSGWQFTSVNQVLLDGMTTVFRQSDSCFRNWQTWWTFPPPPPLLFQISEHSNTTAEQCIFKYNFLHITTHFSFKMKMQGKSCCRARSDTSCILFFSACSFQILLDITNLVFLHVHDDQNYLVWNILYALSFVN